jgi:hypothetical protein
MPIFKFYAGDGLSTNENNLIATSAGSGLGFFGANGSGTSVQVASYQDTTYVTDANGANPVRGCNNIKYLTSSTAKISNGNQTLNITGITNAQATLQIRFQQDNGGANIKTQNVKVWPYDRNASINWPSSVYVQLVELQHTGVNNVGEPTYSGSTSVLWKTFHYDPDLVTGGYVYGNPASSGLTLYPSPGQTGSHPLNTNSTGLYHDWYLGISASPDTIGSKNFGLWVELEYTEVTS